MSDEVIVEKSCPGCGKHISTEIPRNDFFESAIQLYKTAACWACYEYQRRLLKVEGLRSSLWIHLRKAEVKEKANKFKAEGSSRYGSSGYQVTEESQKVKELRSQLETLDKKGQQIITEREEYKTEQKERNNK
jgi:hypothetical protein